MPIVCAKPPSNVLQLLLTAVTITSTRFDSNSSPQCCGALAAADNATVAVQDSTLRNNTSAGPTGMGGAVGVESFAKGMKAGGQEACNA